MSTPFYDLASLVVVPSGYKASKVYAQKPLTTDGQLTFSRASTATRVNSAGLIETVSSNVPRLDYLGSTCPKLQLEPSRTNIVLQSQAFDNAQWFKEALNTVTANTLAAPDGTTTADTITCTNGNNLNVNQSLTITSTGSHTLSIFLKKKTSSVIGIYFFTLQGGAQFAAKANLNLDTGVATADVGTTTVTNYGNGWYRFTVTGTLTAGAVTTCGIYTDSNTGTRDVYAWGAMAELGSYATSYVKTEAAAVTRLADSAYKDGIGSLFGTNVGTFFVDAEGPFFDGNAAYLFDLSDNSSATVNRFAMYSVASNTMALFTNGSTNFTASVTARKKIALIWNGTNTKVYLNGAKVVDITHANANPTSINLNSRFTDAEYGNSKFSQVMAFKTALTEAQAIELTTL